MIRILPDIVINKLKAGEVVERPASVVKELIENALDAQATTITIDIHDGGKTLIMVQDNGQGIQHSDQDLVITRYATSKISDDSDLDHLSSYGFRGEALASIAEVSSITIESKTTHTPIGRHIHKSADILHNKSVALSYDHGTCVWVHDLFCTTPVRRKFLKSSQAEYFYCYQLCNDFALTRPDIHRIIKKNGNIVHNLPPCTSLSDRIIQSFKKDRSPHLLPCQYDHDYLSIQGVIASSKLTFGSSEYCKIIVNGRPIQDRSLQRAIMDGYYRQIATGEYPLAILSITIASDKVDVNVHPRKLQVKFLDPSAVFQSIKSLIQETLGSHKVLHHSPSPTSDYQDNSSPRPTLSSSPRPTQHLSSPSPRPLWETSQTLAYSEATPYQSPTDPHPDTEHGQIIGQLRNSYIIIQYEHHLHYIDQHALAERIAFEKMKKEIQLGQYSASTLLQPISLQIPIQYEQNTLTTALTQLKFEVSWWGDQTLIIYKVPDFVVHYHIDIAKVMRFLLSESDRDYNTARTIDLLLDSILATRACKTSIKAGHQLSLAQMHQLIQDGYTHIPGSFVCQHGRPFVIQIDKSQIDTMFDR